ncbi:MAG: AAA family ATPase [Thermomicrobiales bacterium]
MIPLQLTLRNFLSYRDEATIDFTNIRIACLSGDNGAGKSALLDAITWALWGETRTPSDRDVIFDRRDRDGSHVRLPARGP